MNDLPRMGSVIGRSYEPHNISTLSKVQQQYWTTKQAVFRKLGKKEDEHVVASDSQLDTKLELFSSVRESSAMMQKTVEQYQDKLLNLSHAENSLGKFLKDNGKVDKTRAGKMMAAVGKTMSYTSQQRLAIRVPLIRLHQEVETFRFRAISDTMATVDQMENSRTDYRGALLWMKDVSQELDPDTYKQLEKFRKVQSHVRKTKGNFEKYKLDCLQKIDLLAASRCNMFSHALATYQNTLLHFWEKTSRTMTAVAESFKGYQHYEFSMLKELTEVGKKLADDTGSPSLKPYLDANGEIDKDRLIFFEEYHDDGDQDPNDLKSSKSDSLQNLFDSPLKQSNHNSEKAGTTEMGECLMMGDSLLTLGFDSGCSSSQKLLEQVAGSVDLLTNNPEIDDVDKDNMTLLNEILNTDVNSVALSAFNQQWDDLFQSKPGTSTDDDTSLQEFLPSQLLDMQKEMTLLSVNREGLEASKTNPSPRLSASPKKNDTKINATKSKRVSAKNMSAWFNLFADLDPLANPDAVGKQSGEVDDDRNC